MISFGFRTAFALVFLAILASPTQVFGQKFRMPFKRQQSSQTAHQELQVKHGPWLIMCTSFTGEDAEERARLLCRELAQHRFKTYIYRQTFDYSQSVIGLGWQKPKSVTQLAREGEIKVRDEGADPEPVRMKSANLEKNNEVAVLVGDYSADDDHRAQKALKKIKSLPLQSMGSANSAPTRTGNLERSIGGPLRTAILVPNPMLPDEYFRQNDVDSFIIKLNREGNIEHSLLDCPGIYSVKIASFRGVSTIDPNRIEQGVNEIRTLQKAGQSQENNGLLDAEEKAHHLTQVLRSRGIEAYEFHDRHESYVCVGSFSYVTRRSNDTVLNNPAIVQVVNSCTPEVKSLPGVPNAIIPKSIGGIPLDPEPVPILVPKADRSVRTGGRLSFLRKR